MNMNIENIMHFHFDKVENITGFVTKNVKVKKGDLVEILSRASITSDQPEFYIYIEQICNIFLNPKGILINNVYQFLILIHEDLSADLYINDFPVAIECCSKRDIKKGEMIHENDIADIRSLKFPGFEIKEIDKVIYCFKAGWKFGLFFDLVRNGKLDNKALYLSLGTLYRNLSFQYVYEVLESETQFNEMMKDGWFPFIELLGTDYKTLIKTYQDKFGFENKIKGLLDSFNKERIKRITSKWWNKQIFNDKKKILEAGINAYLRDDDDGYINCLKTLLPEIEGIIRLKYFQDTSKGKQVKMSELLNYITEKGKVRSGSDYSLFLPLPFLNYLNEVIYVGFDLESGEIDLSRHSISHGVAEVKDYTKIRALQTILVLDQIYYFI